MRIGLFVYAVAGLGLGHLQRARHLTAAWGDHDLLWLWDQPPGTRGQRMPEAFGWNRPPADDRELQRRLDEAVGSCDAVVTEYYPFGRYKLREAIKPIFAAAKAHGVPIVSSVRDLLGKPKPFEGWAEHVLQELDTWYDLVLWHGDEQFVPFDYPLVGAMRPPLVATGYVAPQVPAYRSADRHLVASIGSGRRGGQFFALTALAAFRRLSAAGWRMTLITGPDLFPALSQQVSRQPLPGLTVLPWVTDLGAVLAEATVSLSQCGYNTFGQVVRLGVPAVFLPYVEPDDDEQLARAGAIARFPGYRCVPATTPDLADAVAESILAVAAEAPGPPALNWQGPETSLATLLQLKR